MKVLQLVGDSKYGGATYLILEWSKYLISRGCRVDVLSTDGLTVELLHKIPKVKVIDDVYIPREINARSDVNALMKLLELFAREKYDVVHTYTAAPGMLGRIAARLSGTPAIFHHQAGWTVTEFSSWKERIFYTPLEYIATLVSTRGICVSHAVAQQAAPLHIAPLNKLVTICNGIDSENFLKADSFKGSLRSELSLSEETIIIGATGRMSAQKNYSTLLRAAAQLKRIQPNLPFAIVIAGDGPDRFVLESLARQLCIGNLFHSVGFRRDIPKLLVGMDIFINTSLWEGLSISLLEAMAAARPIVATSILPNAELIEHEKTGLLVDVRSPEQVANAIMRFVREPELAIRCGLSARELVLRDYTLSRMFQQTWNLYNEFSANNHE